MPRSRVIPTVRVVHVCPPILVHTDLSNFQAVVQELTGKRKLISTHNKSVGCLDCHICDHAAGHNGTTNITNELSDSPTHIIESCNESRFMNDCSNECSYTCVSIDLGSVDVRNDDTSRYMRQGFLMASPDGCLSPNWSTNSSSSNTSLSYCNNNIEESSSLIGMGAPGSTAAINTACNGQRLDMPELVTIDGECLSPPSACGEVTGSIPLKRAKLIHDDSFLNTMCTSNMEHVFSQHAEESALISGFITPPLFSLVDEQCVAGYGDHDLLQELYDMEIFPLSSVCNLPG